MGTQNPRFFPLMGTVPSTKYCWAPGSCPSVKILSKSVRHGSLGERGKVLKKTKVRAQWHLQTMTLVLCSSLWLRRGGEEIILTNFRVTDIASAHIV